MPAYVLASAAFIVYLVANTHAGYVLGITIGLIEDPEITAFQQETVSHHLRRDRNLTPGRLIFLGDSHILGLDVIQIAQDGVNFGIGGETTVGLRARIERYRSVSQARAVVIGIGYNDIGRRDAVQIVNNIRDILARLSKPVVLSGLLPVSQAQLETSTQAPEMNATIQSVNKMLRSVCRENCVFADPYPVMDSLTDKPSYYEPDGVHLNAKGYLVWTRFLSEFTENP